MIARSSYYVSQLILIPCAILDFLCIHPFPDGNGRISRLLSRILLLHHGYDVGRYISFEGQTEKRKGYYYEALRQSSIGWHESKNDYLPFINEFLTTLFFCYKQLDENFVDTRH
ncbi:MAG: Fic family protein [Clostridiales bacterium]|jgi:Fic family protein|nr:Fic family protein [Clostridiales bacterium]